MLARLHRSAAMLAALEAACCVAAVLLVAFAASGQQTGAIKGKVVLNTTDVPLDHATIVVPQLGRSAETDVFGVYVFLGVPPGTYELVAHMHHLTDERKRVTVTAGAEVEVDFALTLSPVREQVTVTASGREETSLESFLSVASLGSFELAAKNSSTSLGDLLEDQAGVAKRSFGPGTSRPVVRGFDGDRVLVLEDGIRTGTLSSQSGDHGEPIDAAGVERVEVVRGPATLLYGANAIGGVVNVVSSHHQMHQHPHDGFRGHVNGTGGSNNGQGGGGGQFEYGAKGWLLWGSGGGMRTGDYHSPAGRVPNSGSRMSRAEAGVGKYTEPAAFSFGYDRQEGRYGIPYAGRFQTQGGETDGEHGTSLDWRRQQVRFHGGLRKLPRVLEEIGLRLNYTDWNHEELEGDQVGTEFFNKQFIYRGDFQQRRADRLSGSFGFWGMVRDYKAVGEEALTPPVSQNAFALFALEQLDFEKFRLQFGGRLEQNSFDPLELSRRSFTGLSGSAGVHVSTWRGGALVANYTHSYRAPALEELYSHGPHVGNVRFEIGNPNLQRETSDGLDLSLRHQSKRLRGELNFFYYRMGEFIYFAPTSDVEDGLPVAEAAQADSRFLGGEGKLQVGLHRYLWLNVGFDSVSARIDATDEPLPRIPPLRGRVGFELLYRSLTLRPEVISANAQEEIAPNETRTAGYAAANLTASYTIARPHWLHVFSANLFNATNRLYRNHLSFIKDYAPEIGRGVRVSYTLHFF